MINRNSPTFIFVAEYIAFPTLFLLIFGYCALIFVSRSFLGFVPTTILIALGILASYLLGRGFIESKTRKSNDSDTIDT